MKNKKNSQETYWEWNWNINFLMPGVQNDLIGLFKVAEHSFRARFCWWIQHAHKDCKNKNVVNRAIILFMQNPHFLRYFSLLLNAVYWCLYSVIIRIC